MPNSKKRCRNCKKYKRSDRMLCINMGYYCDIGCATGYGFKNKEKGEKKRFNQKKKTFQLSDRKIRKQALKTACHSYIRARDKNKLCICCNEPLGDSYHAGHFIESGNNPKIRYDEDNIHGQRIYCNTYKGGDSGDYENNLRERIGDERVDRLLSLKGGTDKMTTDEMLELEKYYKDKLKELNQKL